MNILKKLKVYITYLTTVSILAVMIIYVAYKNPDLITFLSVDNNYFVESEETINSPFSNTDNVEVVVKTNTQNTQTTNNTPTYVSVNTRTGYAFPTVSGYYISQGYRGTSHDGIDIAGCPYNSNIFAVNDGQVVTVSRKWDNGLYIVIRHDNGYYTMYAHLANAYVSVGQRVSKGQVIGGMGRSGLATGTHLHFSLWNAYPYRGSSLNPFSLY